MAHKIEQLETLARTLIGDAQRPDIFFVTDEGKVVAIDTDFEKAYARWNDLAHRAPRKECALENRTYGVIASISPESDEKGARLVREDDSVSFKRR